MKLETFIEQRNRKLGVVSNKEAWAIPNAYEEFAEKLYKHDWALTLYNVHSINYKRIGKKVLNEC